MNPTLMPIVSLPAVGPTGGLSLNMPQTVMSVRYPTRKQRQLDVGPQPCYLAAMPDAHSRPLIALLNGLNSGTPELHPPRQLAEATSAHLRHFVAGPAEEFDFALDVIRTNHERDPLSLGKVARGRRPGIKSIRTSGQPQQSYCWTL